MPILSAKFCSPSLAALTRLPTKGSGFFRMLFSAGAGLLDVDERLRAHHVEDDLQEIPGGVEAPADELADESSRTCRRRAAKRPGQVEKVLDDEGFHRRDEQPRHLVNEADQFAHRLLEPRPDPLQRVGLLDLLPDVLLAGELHDPADQEFRRRLHRLVGDRIVAQHGDQQVPGLGLRRQRRQAA